MFVRHGSRVLSSATVPFGVEATKSSPTPSWGTRAVHSTSKTSMQMSKSEAPFTTWTFDKHCDTMDWSELPSPTVTISNDASALDDSDLVILAVYGPAKEESDEDEEKKSNDDEEEVAPVLEGKVKEIDEALDGALTDVMMENAKAFKNGAAFAEATPTLRMVTVGDDGVSKVRVVAQIIS